MILTEELKQKIEEQLGKPDYTECPLTPGVFSVNVQIVSSVASGDIWYEYSPGLFALNVQIVSNTTC